MAADVDITVSGARQHLTALVEQGLLDATELARHAGERGRPQLSYAVTGLGDALFPKAYGALTVELLGYLDDDDPGAVDRLFARRRQTRIENATERLRPRRSLKAKVEELARILDEDGYLATAETIGRRRHRIVEHNCAIAAVAGRYGQACSSEIDFIRAVLPDTTVTRTHHMVAGDPTLRLRDHPRPFASIGLGVRQPPRRSALASSPMERRAGDDSGWGDRGVLAATRSALQSIAEHVLAPTLFAANGHIGLRATPRGFGTPVFATRAVHRQARVDGVDLVVADDGRERRTPLTTVGAAAEQLGIEAGAPAEVYTASTPLDLDRLLDLDTAAAATLARFFATADAALGSFLGDDRSKRATGSAASADQSPQVQLWPEHFDLATTLGEVNYGGSPGDAEHPLPYLYVGPWSPPTSTDPYWNEPFGASMSLAADATAEVALAFFREGAERLAR